MGDLKVKIKWRLGLSQYWGRAPTRYFRNFLKYQEYFKKAAREIKAEMAFGDDDCKKGYCG